MRKGNYNAFHEDKKQMLKNPPAGVNSSSWVQCISKSSTTTIGKKYMVRNYFRYLNHYGSPGDKFCMWDEFITIKNDNGFTVKMNLRKFNPCQPPDISDKQRIRKLELEVAQLKNRINYRP